MTDTVAREYPPLSDPERELLAKWHASTLQVGKTYDWAFNGTVTRYKVLSKHRSDNHPDDPGAFDVFDCEVVSKGGRASATAEPRAFEVCASSQCCYESVEVA